MNVGIMGTGNIAGRAVETLRHLDGIDAYAVASRTPKRAKQYAEEQGIAVYYGSYEELVSDPAVDLVYVATPHSEHYENVTLALDHGRHVLCEKAFTLNAAEAGHLAEKARRKGLFLAEAMWIRYLPITAAVHDFVFSGIIGDVRIISMEFFNFVCDRPRIIDPALGGGALLDLGIYCLNHARIHFGADIERTESSVRLYNGVDLQESIQLYYRDGRTVNISVATNAGGGRQCAFFGTKGYVVLDHLQQPRTAAAYDFKRNLLGSCTLPPVITGYEFEFREAAECIRLGRTESVSMPLSETVAVLRMADELRRQWGVVYPCEKFRDE